MDRDRSDEWVARVVAWHNRHPLACRVLPAEVSSLGWVELPYRAAEGAPRRSWRALFSERFLPTMSVRRIAHWALRHGHDSAPGDKALPVRQVPADAADAADGAEVGPGVNRPVSLWLATAAIQRDAAQTRVLLGAGPGAAVLGRRLWSRPRLAVAFAAAAAASAMLFVLVLLLGQPRAHERKVLAAGAAAAASAAPSASASAAAALSAASAAALAAANTPVVVVPNGTITLPFGRPLLDEAAKAAAREASVAARAARAAGVARTAAVAAFPAQAYALATPALRSPAEAALKLGSLQAALRKAGAAKSLRVETLPAGDDWRVVCWPLESRADAQRLRDLLVARGQRIELIAF